MKAYLFSPYFPKHFGGGEKYLLDVARSLAKMKSCHVDIGISSISKYSKTQLCNIKREYERFFDYNLDGVDFVNTPLGIKGNFLKKSIWTKNYDLGFYLTDGSLFYSFAKKNILHIQVPLRLNKSSLIDKAKLKSWDIITTNSEFTKSVVEPNWGIKVTTAHQPMVEVDSLIEKTVFANKQKIILNVGRFFSQLHCKRQDILIGIFRRLKEQYKRETKDWKFVLIGSVEDNSFFSKVKDLAKGLPVEFITDVTRNEVLNWYQKSSIYWHGTGYRVNQELEPEKVEHFGISTVEAMAAGNVPIVIAKGGQPEVIGEELFDWSWLTQDECIKKTRQIINNENLRHQLQLKAQLRSRQFGEKLFEKKLFELLG